MDSWVQVDEGRCHENQKDTDTIVQVRVQKLETFISQNRHPVRRQGRDINQYNSKMNEIKLQDRYLRDFPEVRWIYSRQGMSNHLDVYDNSDWTDNEERQSLPLEFQRPLKVIQSTLRPRCNFRETLTRVGTTLYQRSTSWQRGITRRCQGYEVIKSSRTRNRQIQITRWHRDSFWRGHFQISSIHW